MSSIYACAFIYLSKCFAVFVGFYIDVI